MSFWTSEFNLDRLRRGAVAMLLVIISAGFVSPHALAQPAPVLTIGGQTGSITLVSGAPYEFAGTGLTPSATAQRHGFTGADCVTHSYLTDAIADDQGEYSVTLQFFLSGTISLRLEDPVLGNSNCVTVTLVAPSPTPPPTETPIPTATSTPTETPVPTATPFATETSEPSSTAIATEDVPTPEPTESCNVSTGNTVHFAQVVTCETAEASPEPVDPTTAATEPVTGLPSTGTGNASSGGVYAMVLLVSAAMMGLAANGWKRRAR